MVMHERQDTTASLEAKLARDISSRRHKDYIPAIASPICLFPPVDVLIPTSYMRLSALHNG